MFTQKTQNRSRKCTLILFVAIFFLWLGSVVAKAAGGDSPQTVFKAAQEAGAKKDFSTLAKLIAPSEQPMLAFGTDMAVGMFIEFYEGEKVDQLKKSYQVIQSKHKVKTENEDDGEKLQITQDTPQDVIDAHMRKRAIKLYGHVDVTNYVPDLMAIVVNIPEMAEQSFFPQEELSNLKIDGDKATGLAGEKRISFIREDDRWFLTADVME